MMMQGLRNASKTWLGKTVVGILFAFLIVSFAIWGIGDIFRGGARNTVATVGKTEIGLEQVRTAYQNEVQRLSRRLRQNITPDQARALGLDQQILSRLVTEAALDNEARALGLSIGDDVVARSIVEDQNFRNASGQFDRGLFNELLRQAGMNEATYVREQRAALLRNQLAEAISGQIAAPGAMLELAHRHQNEQRVLGFVELAPAKAGEIAEPTEEALRKFFEDRRAQFRAPEYRTARVLVLTPQTLADPAALSEAEVAEHYGRIRSRFGAPERRTIQQIVFPTQAEAQAAVERIRGGITFDDVASQRGISEADLTLGNLTRAEVLDQNVAAAAFTLEPNVVSDPVQGPFGYAVVRVAAIEPERIRPLAEVAAEVRADLANQRAVTRLSEAHDRVEDMRASARPLQEIAAEMRLPAATLGPIDRTRRNPDGQPVVTNFPNVEQLVEAVFRADIGTDNEPVRTRDNGYVWFDVTTIDLARERTFEEVRSIVAAQWREEEVATRLQQLARDLAGRINKGETLEAAVAALGVEVQTSPPLTRASSLPEFPAGVLNAAFSTPVAQAASAPLPAGRGRMLLQVRSATVTPFLRTTQEADQLSQQLGVAMGDDLLSQYVSALQNRQGVSINQQNFRNATGGDS